MVLNLADALSFCHKWQEEKSIVRFVLRSPIVPMRFTGTIVEVIEPSDEPPFVKFASEDISSDGLPACISTICFALAVSFSFVDPRDAGAGREIMEGEMDFGLIINFLSGERCILYELANPDSQSLGESSI